MAAMARRRDSAAGGLAWLWLLWRWPAAGAVSEGKLCFDSEYRDTILNSITMGFVDEPIIRVARSPWTTHEIVAEIFRIIVVDHFGYKVELAAVRNSAEGYRRLVADEIDVNLELWPTSAPQAYAEFSSAAASQGQPVRDAGLIGYYGQSGLFVMPSDRDAEIFRQQGRWYQNFEKMVQPTVMKADEFVSSGLVEPGRYTMNETLCQAGGSCTAILKDDPLLDMDKVESMMIDAGLNATVVYLGRNGTEAFLDGVSRGGKARPERSVLFYSYVPSMLLAAFPDSFLRLVFEDPGVCTDLAFAAGMSERRACDFSRTTMHKATTGRFRRNYQDVGYMVSNMRFTMEDIRSLILEVRTGATVEQVACNWVAGHAEVWEAWLQPGQGHSFSMKILIGVSFGLLVLVILWWLLYPTLIYRQPFTPQWEPVYQGPSEYWYWKAAWPGFLHQYVIWPLVGLAASCRKRLSKRKAKCASSGGWTCCCPKVEPADGPAVRPRRSLRRWSVTSMRDQAYGKITKTQDAIRKKLLADGSSTKALARTQPVMQQLTGQEMRLMSVVLALLLKTSGKAREKLDLERLPARVHERLQEGLQFSQGVYHGSAGAQEGRVCVVIMRGQAYSEKALAVKVTIAGGSAKDGIDVSLEDNGELILPAGQRMVSAHITVRRYPHGLGMGSLWLPYRYLDLEVSATEDESGEAVVLGATRTAQVHVVNTSEWPCPGVSKLSDQSLLWRFCLEVFKGNWYREVYWFINITFKNIHRNAIDPLFLKLIVDNAMEGSHNDYSITLAMVKLACVLLEQYLQQQLSVEYPICWIKPWQWLFTKWATLPLLQAEEERHSFRLTCERIDMEFAGKTYKKVTACIESGVSIIVVVCSSSWLSGRTFMYISLLTYFTEIALFSVILIVPVGYAAAHEASWRYHSKFVELREKFWAEPGLQRTYETSNSDVDVLVLAHRMRKVEQDKQWYLRHNRLDFVTWLTFMPVVILLLTAPLLVERLEVNAGTIVALLANLRTVQQALLKMVQHQEDLICARECVRDFAGTMNGHLQESTAAARYCDLVSRLRLTGSDQVDVDMFGDTSMSTICLQGVRSTRAAAGYRRVDGSIEPGKLYGLSNTKANRVLLDTLAGLLVPEDGAVLIPPSMRILAVSSLTHLASHHRTVLDSLRCGLRSPTAVKEMWIWNLCGALGMDPSVFCAEHRDVPLYKVAWMLPQLDLQLVALVRALICLPDVLLVHPLEVGDPRRAALVRGVLTNFVQGSSVSRLSRLPRSVASPSAKPEVQKLDLPGRTVVWIADAAVLRTLHGLEVPAARLSVCRSGQLREACCSLGVSNRSSRLTAGLTMEQHAALLRDFSTDNEAIVLSEIGPDGVPSPYVPRDPKRATTDDASPFSNSGWASQNSGGSDADLGNVQWEEENGLQCAWHGVAYSL